MISVVRLTRPVAGLSRLVARSPDDGDFVVLAEVNASAHERAHMLLARCCGVEVEVIRALAPADLSTLAAVVNRQL